MNISDVIGVKINIVFVVIIIIIIIMAEMAVV